MVDNYNTSYHYTRISYFHSDWIYLDLAFISRNSWSYFH